MFKTAQKKMVILATFSPICVFLLFFYYAGISVVFGQREERLLTTVVGESAQKETRKAAEISLKTVTDYGAENLRDPFQDYLIKEPEISGQTSIPENQVETPKPPTLQIQGIFWGANFPQAIVNKVVVKEGDMIEGVKIIAIKKEGLTLSFANIEYKLAAPAYAGQDNPKTKKEGGI